MARTLADNFRLLETAPLRLGILSTIGHTRLTRFLARLEAAHPGIELAVSEGSMSDLRGGLDTGRRDAAILSDLDGAGEALRLQPLYEERYVVVIPTR